MEHERDRYGAACNADFPEAKNPELLALRPTLGTSMATVTVEVVRIAITSETTRDAVFLQTKTYDVAKLTALRGWANSLYARLSTQPVQAVAEERSSYEKNPRCSSYHFSVVDPVSGWRVDLASKKAWYKWSDAEIDGACSYGGDMFAETARKAAKTVEFSKDDFWHGLPASLWWHRGYIEGNLSESECQRVASFQLFDDGWRIINTEDIDHCLD
jgi:hypothetical protein